MSNTYLVTGGGGNLARQIATRLLESGSKVVALDLGENNYPDLDDAIYVKGDVTNQLLLGDIFQDHQPTHILHMASLLSGSSEMNRTRGWEINATAGIQLMEMALENGVQSFFFPSTSGTYGSGLPNPLPEDYPQWPETLYGVTKVAMERAGWYYKLKHGLDFRCVRLPMVLSRYAPPGALSAYGSHALVAAEKGKHFVFPVNPESAPSVIYVKDVSDSILQLMDAPVESLKQPVYNLHGYSSTASEIAEAIKAQKPDFEYTFEPNPVVVKFTDDLAKVSIDEGARRDWGWEPKYDLARTVEDFCSEN